MKKLILLLLVGCTVPQAYTAGDRATYNAVAHEYVAYVGSDTALTDEQKTRRLETIRSWEARIQAEEKEPEGDSTSAASSPISYGACVAVNPNGSCSCGDHLCRVPCVNCCPQVNPCKPVNPSF